MSVGVFISIVGDIARIQVDLLDSVVLRSLRGRRRAFRVTLFDGRFLARFLTRRSFLRGFGRLQACGEHLFKLLERRGVGWCVGRGHVRCGSVETRLPPLRGVCTLSVSSVDMSG
uniref:Uncharacterized protein n=1 Tax=Brassica oleracea var. oleracea TaxID=109376 RepID=A0A0D3ACA4_BRAOL